jgi:hypothetical protein
MVMQYYTYDNAGRVSALNNVNQVPPVVTSFNYARNENGAITTAGRESSLSIYYAYDSLDRLKREFWQKANGSFVYGHYCLTSKVLVHPSGRDQVLHDRQYGLHHVLHATRERGPFPAPGVALDAEAEARRAQPREPHAVALLGLSVRSHFLPPEDEVFAVDANVHAGRHGVSGEKSREPS